MASAALANFIDAMEKADEQDRRVRDFDQCAHTELEKSRQLLAVRGDKHNSAFLPILPFLNSSSVTAVPTSNPPVQVIGLGAMPVHSYQLLFEIAYAIDIRLERCHYKRGPDLWAIRDFSRCLGKDGQWMEEPTPSERTHHFYEHARWDSPEEAFAFWQDNDCAKTFDRYRKENL